MSLEAHRLSVESTLQARIRASYPSVPIKFQNAPFKQPETTWVALHLIDGNSFLTNLGRGKQIDRHVGYVQVDVLVPSLTGTKQAFTMSDWLGKIWRLQTDSLGDGSVVRYRTPMITSLGDDSGFFRVCVRIPYWRDEPAQ